MTPVTSRRMLQILASKGWVIARQTGSHAILSFPGRPGIVVVPRHAGDLKTGTQRTIMRQAGLTNADL